MSCMFVCLYVMSVWSTLVEMKGTCFLHARGDKKVDSALDLLSFVFLFFPRSLLTAATKRLRQPSSWHSWTKDLHTYVMTESEKATESDTRLKDMKDRIDRRRDDKSYCNEAANKIYEQAVKAAHGKNVGKTTAFVEYFWGNDNFTEAKSQPTTKRGLKCKMLRRAKWHLGKSLSADPASGCNATQLLREVEQLLLLEERLLLKEQLVQIAMWIKVAEGTNDNRITAAKSLYQKAEELAQKSEVNRALSAVYYFWGDVNFTDAKGEKDSELKQFLLRQANSHLETSISYHDKQDSKTMLHAVGEAEAKFQCDKLIEWIEENEDNTRSALRERAEWFRSRAYKALRGGDFRKSQAFACTFLGFAELDAVERTDDLELKCSMLCRAQHHLDFSVALEALQCQKDLTVGMQNAKHHVVQELSKTLSNFIQEVKHQKENVQLLIGEDQLESLQDDGQKQMLLKLLALFEQSGNAHNEKEKLRVLDFLLPDAQALSKRLDTHHNLVALVYQYLGLEAVKCANQEDNPQRKRGLLLSAHRVLDLSTFHDGTSESNLQRAVQRTIEVPPGFLHRQTPSCFISFWRWVESGDHTLRNVNIKRLSPKLLFRAYGQQNVSRSAETICGKAFVEALNWVTNQANNNEQFIRDRFNHDVWVRRTFTEADFQEMKRDFKGGIHYEPPLQLAVELCINYGLRRKVMEGVEFTWQFQTQVRKVKPDGKLCSGFADVCFERRSCSYRSEWHGVRRVVLELKVWHSFCFDSPEKMVLGAVTQLQDYMPRHHEMLYEAHGVVGVWFNRWGSYAIHYASAGTVHGHTIMLCNGKVVEGQHLSQVTAVLPVEASAAQ